MKLKIKRGDIINGLQKAASIIPLKAPSVSLRSIWLKAEKDRISIMTTDADMEFTGIYPAEVEQEGLVGVLGRSFADLIAKWPAGDINISLDESSQTLRLEQGRRNYKLPVSSVEWFQPFAAWPEGPNAIWTGDFLSAILEKVNFCIDDDDARDAMATLCMKPVADGRIDACGLNGHQFAMFSFINDELASMFSENGLMIQKKYLGDLKKWLAPGEIELNLTEKRLFLRQLDGAEILSIPRYVRNAFPDYNLFLSKLEGGGVARLSVSRKAAIEALSRIMVFMTDTNRCVYMDLGEGELRMIAQGADNGSGRETLEADYSGDMDRIAFPTRELLEIFNHFESEYIDMHFTGQEGPCGITGPDDPSYTVVIMPMRVTDFDGLKPF